MIEYFRTDDNGTLLKLGQEEPGCWIALFDPDVKELADIVRGRVPNPDLYDHDIAVHKVTLMACGMES